MNLATATRTQFQQAAASLIGYFRKNPDTAGPDRHRDCLIFAVSHCHPTRIVLYTAAFQAGWRIVFWTSLREALAAAELQPPNALIYDHNTHDPAWNGFCSTFAARRIPFLQLAHFAADDLFLNTLAAGGYFVGGSPLTSESVVSAVDVAAEISGLAGAPLRMLHQNP